MKELIIPKIIDLKSWNEINGFDDFSSPWDHNDQQITNFKSYHNGEAIFFQFKVFGPTPLIYIKDNNKLEVRFSERVELFFRKDKKMDPYYCLEIDPLGRVLDYKSKYYRDFDRSWEWPDDLKIKTEITGNAYLIHGQINIKVLQKLGLINANEIEVGVYRGHCISLEENNATIHWMSWVDPKVPTPDFHVHTSFGRFILDSE